MAANQLPVRTDYVETQALASSLREANMQVRDFQRQMQNANAMAQQVQSSQVLWRSLGTPAGVAAATRMIEGSYRRREYAAGSSERLSETRRGTIGGRGHQDALTMELTAAMSKAFNAALERGQVAAQYGALLRTGGGADTRDKTARANYAGGAAEASAGRQAAIIDRKSIGGPEHMRMLREQIGLQKEMQINARANNLAGLQAEFGRVGGRIKQMAEDFAEVGRVSSRAFAIGAGAVGMMVRAASPDTWATLTGSIELLAARIGNAFIPQIERLANWIQKAADWVKSLDSETKSSIVTWVVWGVAIAGGVMVLSRAIIIVGGLVTAFSYLPIAIRAVSAAMAFLYANPWVLAIGAIAIAIAYLTDGFGLLRRNVDASAQSMAAMQAGANTNNLVTNLLPVAQGGQGASPQTMTPADTVVMQANQTQYAAAQAAIAALQTRIESQAQVTATVQAALTMPTNTGWGALAATRRIENISAAFQNIPEDRLPPGFTPPAVPPGASATARNVAWASATREYLASLPGDVLTRYAGYPTGQLAAGPSTMPADVASPLAAQIAGGTGQNNQNAIAQMNAATVARSTAMQWLQSRNLPLAGMPPPPLSGGALARSAPPVYLESPHARTEHFGGSAEAQQQFMASTHYVTANRRNPLQGGWPQVVPFTPAGQQEIGMMMRWYRVVHTGGGASGAAGPPAAPLTVGAVTVTGEAAASLRTMVSLQFQSQQIGIEQLHDMIQRESVRAPLEQALFEVQRDGLRALLEAVGVTNINLEAMQRAIDDLYRQGQ